MCNLDIFSVAQGCSDGATRCFRFVNADASHSRFAPKLGARPGAGTTGPVVALAVAAATARQKDICEHWSGDGYLGHNSAAITDDLGADLDQLLPQSCQRPVLDRLVRGEGAQEVRSCGSGA